MANKVVPINNLPQFGVVKDTPTVGLAPNVFTDARNIRFRDMAAHKMKGDVALTPDLNPSMPTTGGGASHTYTAGQIVFITWWNNPNLVPSNTTYYVFVIEQKHGSVVVGHRTFLYRTDGTINDVTPSFSRTVNSTSYTDAGFDAGYTTSGEDKGNWQATEFAGGFCLIVNNGIQAPHYIMDTTDNTAIGSVPNFAKLPGWESYNSAPKVLEATVQLAFGDTGVTPENPLLFDLGQKIDFTKNTLFVTKQSPNQSTTECAPISAATNAGSNTPNAANFVPGDVPASPATNPTGADNNNFQYGIYHNPETNTTNIIFNVNILQDDIVRCFVISRNPIATSCGVIRSFGNFLVAGNLKETTTAGVVRSLPGVVRTSDVAVPGSVPQNWNPFAAGTNTADEFTLSDTATVQDLVQLQGNMYIYTNTSIHNLRLTNSIVTPVAFSPVTSQYGAQTTAGVVEFNGKHLVVGSNDIYLFSGNPGNITSIADTKVRDYFYKHLNNAKANKLFILRNQKEDEIWINYPKITYNDNGTINNSSTVCNEALIYNYRLNNWTVRDLNGIVSGVIAPVKGAVNAERPWSDTTVSFDKLFPVFAQVCTSGTSNSGSSILAADIGYTHRVLDNTDDPYTSFLERKNLSITPEFYTEAFSSIALLTQGTGTLNVKTISSNSPGATIDFTSSSTNTNTFNVATSYKSDARLNGRFISYKIDDGTTTSTSWNLSGIQIEVQDGGTR
tara:strand:+ start:9495 stop:11681 length:2187 start_codon:yes stop_codon:yes gene_type:complete